MPWKETDAEMERLKFIAALEAGNEPVAEICRQFGISRQTGYTWKRRFEEGGVQALADRRPDSESHPNLTPDEVADALVAARKAHPTWGPKKLRAWLAAHRPELAVPAASTIGEVLKRRGLIAPRKRRLKAPPSTTPLAQYTGPNSVWCIDHKGHFALSGRQRCYPLTMMDGFSRYLLKCEALPSTSEREARPHVEAAFREFGLPMYLRSDNGVPFVSPGTPGRLSPMGVWWIKLGIHPEHIRLGHPEENGRLERFHRTLEEAISKEPRTMCEQQRRFDELRGEYNHERPHEALAQRTPAAHYETSWRPFPASVKPPEYEDDINVRMVTDHGHASWRGHPVHVGKVLHGEPVYFEEVAENRWNVRFGPVYLVTLELRDGKPRVTAALPSRTEPVATTA
jgi:putative transposase